jgi:Asp-tRNA(Asn)/Glu-tRNA(Gln) amidotransferase A subunit family amidase
MSLSRREIMAALAGAGVGSLPFQRSLAVTLEQDPPKASGITPEQIQQAEWVAGITLTEEERKRVASSLSAVYRGITAGRTLKLPNHVPPALHFNPTPGELSNGDRGKVAIPVTDARMPASNDDLAFAPVHVLCQLLAKKQVSSVELTKLFLDRLHKYNEKLKFVVTFTDELALKQAKRADEEIAAGKSRGPLHGIPWGAKDLIAVAGFPTTWGAEHYKTQTINDTATVAKKLEEAGAVLVAKLTLGALAWGDQWFGGRTNNPWDPSRGSSGSSAGSASAVSAGCVPFAIGSETLGSIVSPSRECGTTGLRPTFGRISRAGCMTLSWSMDKLGPMARCVDDCAVVLGTIHGADPLDPPSVTRPFHWPGTKPVNQLKIGFFENSTQESYKAALTVLCDAGATLVPVKLPTSIPTAAVSYILGVEAATAFDDITRDGVKTGIGLWPTTFRESRFISAVDYLRANRLRTLLMREMAKLMETVDLYVGGNDLQITNLTGHPTICMPNGFTKSGMTERPGSLTMTGRLFGETELLTAAKVFQDATGHHLKRPKLDG